MTITPAWLQNLTYDAIYDRMWVTAMGIEPGVTKPLSYKVTATTGLGISVAAGTALVKGSDISFQGLYSVLNTAAVALTATTAPASSTRVDLVVLEVRDQASNGVAANDARVRIVAGTPGGGTPAQPASSLLLATLTVTAGLTTITSANIADKRTLGGACGQIGDVKAWSGGLLPTNYDYADGGAISRTTFAEYFELVGTKHGAGNGSTTFNKPDLRGCTLQGMDNMGTAQGSANRNTDANADVLGGRGGAETVTLVAANLPPHPHAMADHRHGEPGGGLGPHGQGSANFGGAVPGSTPANYSQYGGYMENPNISTGNGPGTSTPINIKDPYIALPIIVKVA